MRPWRPARASASSRLTRSTVVKKRPRDPARMQLRAMAMARCVLPVPVETATWRRDSGERRDDLLRLSSARWQDGGLERSARRLRGDVHLTIRLADGTLTLTPEWMLRPVAAACEIRSAPRLCMARLRGPRAYLDAVLGSAHGDSPLTDGADHAPESPTTGSVRRAAAPATDRERTPPGDGGECASAPGGGASAGGLVLDPEGGAP